MLMPDKTLTLTNAIIGIGSVILKALGPNDTISWSKVNKGNEIAFDRFTLALDFLYVIKAIHYNDGLIKIGAVTDNDSKSKG